MRNNFWKHRSLQPNVMLTKKEAYQYWYFSVQSATHGFTWIRLETNKCNSNVQLLSVWFAPWPCKSVCGYMSRLRERDGEKRLVFSAQNTWDSMWLCNAALPFTLLLMGAQITWFLDITCNYKLLTTHQIYSTYTIGRGAPWGPLDPHGLKGPRL